ncbi:hypothetical protein AB0942_09600 [Streptomyces nodosus]|uniref:hypothetical protein n=1 Tax=Streptomyces nodosus TaxID=40318 RepID=UPI003453863D
MPQQDKSKKPTGISHQQRIARELKDVAGIGYQDALQRVSQAHQLGLLPAVLDRAGIQEAARRLADAVPPRAAAGGPPEAAGLSPQSFTPFGAALLFASRYSTRLRHATGLGWLSHEGHRWVVLPDDKLPRLAVAELTDHLQEQAAPVQPDEHPRYRSAGGWRDLLVLAAATEGITIDPLALDSDSSVLCTPGGLVDLKSGARRPVDPGRDFPTRCTRVAPDGRSTPRWDRFLLDAFGDGPEGDQTRNYLQVLLGYSLTGDVNGRIVPLLTGTGLGKTTLMTIVTEVMGSYAERVPLRMLDDNGTAAVDVLRGVRLVSSDVEAPHRKLPTHPVGDILTAQRLGQPPFQIRLHHHVWYTALALGPQPADVQARLRPIGFTRPLSRTDPDLALRVVQEEGPGVLQWMLDGARRYLEHHQPTGPAPLAALPAPGHADCVSRFLAERCVPDAVGSVRQDLLRAAYIDWCEDNGCKPLPAREMALRVLDALETRHMIKSGGYRHFPGLTLRR